VGNVIGVDVGGTHMRVGIVDDGGRVLNRAVRPTAEADSGASALAELLRELQAPPNVPAVVGLPGRIDYRGGHLETAPNLPRAWVAELGEDVLRRRLGRPVHLANDADLAAVGEFCFGAGRDHDDVLYVTLSTGVGAGLILGGRLVAGRRSSAEIGHTVIDFRAPAGSRTVEELGSGTALGAAANAVGLPSGEPLAELVRNGDSRARAVWDPAVRAAAVGIANLCWIAAPSVVVVGGGLGRNGALVLDPIRDTIAELGPSDIASSITVVQAQLGDDAALAGSAGWRGVGPTRRDAAQ
jgi:glucokinase